MKSTPTIYSDPDDDIRVHSPENASVAFAHCISIGSPIGGWARIHMTRAKLADLRAHIDDALMATVRS